MLLKNLFNRAVLELKKAGIASAGLDAQVLLEEAISCDRSFTFAHPDFLITNAQYSRFRRLIRRRKTGEPIAYILGHKEFYGLDFIVNKNVLVPRPETEQLVEWGIKYITNQSAIDKRQLAICDIGTGSGNIVISIALNAQFSMHNAIFYASDISSSALRIAKKNARKLNSENIRFLKSDLFLNRQIKNKVFDLLIANLPYVPYSKIKKTNSISYEPKSAIFADKNGAAVIKRFLEESTKHIHKQGLILLELDPRNAKAIKEYAEKVFPSAEIELRKDLAKLDRYLIINI